MDTAGPLSGAAQHIFGCGYFGTSLKLGAHPRKNGHEEGICTVLNKNRWIIKPHVGYAKDGSRGRHRVSPSAQTNLQAVGRTVPAFLDTPS